MGKALFTVAQFIKAIPGTGGNITTIAGRVGCQWHTAKKYIEEHPTVKVAYDAERDAILDVAESVIAVNIKLAQKQQVDIRLPVDSSDAKWLLSRRGKERGYVERQEVTGAAGGPVAITTVEIVKDYGDNAP